MNSLNFRYQNSGLHNFFYELKNEYNFHRVHCRKSLGFKIFLYLHFSQIQYSTKPSNIDLCLLSINEFNFIFFHELRARKLFLQNPCNVETEIIFVCTEKCRQFEIGDSYGINYFEQTRSASSFLEFREKQTKNCWKFSWRLDKVFCWRLHWI